MDVNGTRFHLLLGRDDWALRCRTESGQPLAESFLASERGGDAELSWNDQRHELTLGVRVFYFRGSPGDHPVRAEQRRGAACDMYGNIYWIAENGTEIVASSAGTRATAHFWASGDRRRPVGDREPFGAFSACPGDAAPAPVVFSGLTVTTQHYLVVGTLAPAGLLVFDLQRGGDSRHLLWPNTVAFAPQDMSATADGGVVILDRSGPRVWQLDRTFAVVSRHGGAPAVHPEDFVAADGSGGHPGPRPSAITSDLAVVIDATRPVAIAALPDGSFLVLDSPPGARFSTIGRYRDGARLGGDLSTGTATPLVDQDKRSRFRLLGHDFAYVAKTAGTEEPTGDLLFVVGEEGDQAFAFQLTGQEEHVDLRPLADYYPMRLFGGKALIVGPGGQALYDIEDRWVPLVAQRRTRFAGAATLTVRTLDGKGPDCTWHRLFLDAVIPPECEVIVASRASNDEALLPGIAWDEEPRLLRRPTGSELPWVDAGVDTWELLFQRAKGRYLELRLTLGGTGRSTPRIRALRAYYPRFSYLDHYLPAVYREDAASASFVERFLANVEGVLTDIEGRVAASQALIDVDSIPADALEWLATWFGVALDPAWDADRRRLFLRHAAEFFEWRGTAAGLSMALRLVIEECPDDSIFDLNAKGRSAVRIVEKFRTRATPGVVFGDTSEVEGLPLRAQRARWDASQGAADLGRRFAERTGREYATRAPEASPDRQAGVAWATFSRETLGFVPRATGADTDRWRAFLRRRYPSLATLNDAYRASYGDWSEIELPDRVPHRGAALRDWMLFEGVVLPARDAAHRFTVFLPQATLGLADREKRVDLARRVIALEKPAHTTFDVKFYWAFFRLGEARLGEETVVDVGSRSPEFLSPFVLDRNFLGSGYLAPERRSRLSLPCAEAGGGCPPSPTGGPR